MVWCCFLLQWCCLLPPSMGCAVVLLFSWMVLLFSSLSPCWWCCFHLLLFLVWLIFTSKIHFGGKINARFHVPTKKINCNFEIQKHASQIELFVLLIGEGGKQHYPKDEDEEEGSTTKRRSRHSCTIQKEEEGQAAPPKRRQQLHTKATAHKGRGRKHHHPKGGGRRQHHPRVKTPLRTHRCSSLLVWCCFHHHFLWVVAPSSPPPFWWCCFPSLCPFEKNMYIYIFLFI